jgi:hypothetical protein
VLGETVTLAQAAGMGCVLAGVLMQGLATSLG